MHSFTDFLFYPNRTSQYKEIFEQNLDPLLLSKVSKIRLSRSINKQLIPGSIDFNRILLNFATNCIQIPSGWPEGSLMEDNSWRPQNVFTDVVAQEKKQKKSAK